MLAIVSSSAAFAPVAPVAPVATRAAAPQMGFGKAELMSKPATRHTYGLPGPNHVPKSTVNSRADDSH